MATFFRRKIISTDVEKFLCNVDFQKPHGHHMDKPMSFMQRGKEDGIIKITKPCVIYDQKTTVYAKIWFLFVWIYKSRADSVAFGRVVGG